MRSSSRGARRPLFGFALGLAFLGGAAGLAPGCGTEAQGIEACRKVEEERCRQAPACGDLAITTADDVQACVRFYRDQCLHGLVTADPGAPVVDRCVRAIQAAGTCALDTAKRDDISTCDPAIATKGSDAKRPCDIILAPDKADDCAWLTPTPDAGSDAGVDATDDGATADAAAE